MTPADEGLRGELDELRRELERTQDDLRQMQELAERNAGAAEAVDLALGAMLAASLPPETRIRRSFGGDGSRVICALATGHDYRALLARSALSFERYAERWGWDLVLSTETALSDGRPSPWGKIRLLVDLVERHEWVLLLDADVVITDLDADVLFETEPGKDLYLVEHEWLGEHTANSGVMLLRGGPWARAFLEAVWAKEEFIDDRFWENTAVDELLGYGLDPFRLVAPTTWLARTKLLDRRFNSIELDPAPRPAFVHRGFYDTRTRQRQVTADLACAIGGADPVTAGRDWPAQRVVRVADVRRRDELPTVLDALAAVEGAVVLGDPRGLLSAWTLEQWTGDRLFTIDPWAGSALADAEHLETTLRLAEHGARSVVWQATSAEAAPNFPEPCLHLVHLGASHDPTALRRELDRWWPKLRSEGIVVGTVPTGIDDRRVVKAFAQERGVSVHLTADDDRQSWILQRP